MILVCAGDVPTDLADALNATGMSWKHASSLGVARDLQPSDGWAASVVAFDHWDLAKDCCDRLRTARSGAVIAVIDAAWFESEQLAELLCDDFVARPAHPNEIATRLLKCISRSAGESDGVIRLGALTLDLNTYQAAFYGRPLDLTYMEYELLKHFASNPGVLFTREELLRDVWGYEYFGGGRTVDVHVRRLRSKFGQEHAHMIETVRSVGYMFAKVGD